MLSGETGWLDKTESTSSSSSGSASSSSGSSSISGSGGGGGGGVTGEFPVCGSDTRTESGGSVEPRK